MPKSGLNVALKGLDDLFSSEETRQEEQREQVQQIPVDELFPFKNHPFKVLDDDAMTRTVESISQFGVLAPLIARPRPEGGYEIISGHRRKHAAELAHLDTVPVIVRNMEDDAATILMVDSNLQREHILPSERAFAYKMKLDAIKNQGARSDLTSSQVGTKLRADEKVAKDSGESRNQVQRFVRLTNLVPELLDMVDEKKISFNPAVELSYLDEKQQQDFLEIGALLLSAVLCIGMAAPAFAYGDDTAPVEQPVLPEVVEEDVVTITDETTGALTPEGNLTLVDDYHTNYSDGSGQQFITLVSKSGATFYLVIDRNAKGQQTVHFMNLVDEADLLALMEEEAADAYTAEKEAAAQAELDRLKAEEEAKKAAEEAATAEPPKENKITKYAGAFLGVVALIALAAGGGFYFYRQQMQKKMAEKEALDPDADYTEDKDDFDIPTDVPDEDEAPDEQDTEPI